MTIIQRIKNRLFKKGDNTDPVYEFFVHSRKEDRTELYEKALRAAEADQKVILKKYQEKFGS